MGDFPLSQLGVGRGNLQADFDELYMWPEASKQSQGGQAGPACGSCLVTVLADS